MTHDHRNPHQRFSIRRYGLSGSLGTITNLVVATLLYQVGVPLKYATPAGFFAGGQVAFWMHLCYSFKSRGHHKTRKLRRFLLFESICTVIAMANYSFVDILKTHTNWYGALVLAISFALFSPLGAVANNQLVFPKQPPKHHP